MTPHAHWRPAVSALGLAGLLLVMPAGLSAQDVDGVTLDLGGPPTAVVVDTIPTAVLRDALQRFNAPGTTRIFGGTQLNTPVDGSVGVYDADVRISTRITGDIVIINGSLRLDSRGRVDGTITVLGGRFFADSGAQYSRPVIEYRHRADVRRTADTRLVQAPPAPTLRDITGQMSFTVGAVTVLPRIGVGVYNRVEGLPIRLGPSFTWQPMPELDARLDADVILRSAPDEADTRHAIGWWTRLALRRAGEQPLTVGVEGGSRVEATAERQLSPAEASISALMFRRDRRDWFERRALAFFADWRPQPTLAVQANLAVARERSVAAVDAFSILRNDEPWRPNPLIDDGKFTTIAAGVTWDTRDEASAPRDGWWITGGLRRTTSGDLTPVLLPEDLRDGLPSEGYEAWEAGFDLRRYQLIDPRHTLNLRFMGRGWIGGDPLTIQRRLALGGDDFLPGYDFRTVTCDSRRRPDPARPALCDRQMMLQAELRRTVDVRIGSRVGPYALGVDRADLLLFADFGSAWIAGDGPGQVPAGRIQALGEWRADLGVGFDAGWFGAYLARSLTDDEPLRLSVRLSRRF